MNVKQITSGVLAATLLMGGLAACGNEEESGATTPTGEITVVSREEGSGTRGAFVELFGVVDADENDITTATAEITNSTSVMMTTVAGNEQAIGYVSLGSLSDEVKAVPIDGVEATAENVAAGTYKVARPFNICYQDGLSELASDFVSYILSADGQAVIAEEGYIAVADGEAYEASGLTGTITISGSTSVGPVMEKLADAYKALNSGVTIEIEQNGSSAGIQAATEGVSEIGMSSRALTDEEKAGLNEVQIATDGIAVIANLNNGITGLTTEQVQKIYLGEITTWEEVVA